MTSVDSFIKTTSDQAARALVDAIGNCQTREQAERVAIGAVCSIAGAAGAILAPNLPGRSKEGAADILEIVADAIRGDVGEPCPEGALHGKTIGTLVAMIQRRDAAIAGLKATIASQAAVIAGQEQDIERQAGAERTGNV